MTAMDVRLVAAKGRTVAEQMLAVHEATATHAYAHIFSSPFPRTEVRTRWANFEGRVVIARRQGNIVGFAAATEVTLEVLYVLPADAGAGLGTALLDAIGPVVRLWVLAENQAGRAFYERRCWWWSGVAQGADDAGGATERLYVVAIRSRGRRIRPLALRPEPAPDGQAP